MEETVHEWLTHTAPGRIEYRKVAVTEEDAVVGYAVSVHETWDPEGQFYAWAGVAPSWRGKTFVVSAPRCTPICCDSWKVTKP